MELQMLATGEYYRTAEQDPIRFYRTPLLGRLYRNRVAGCVSLLPNGRRVLEIGYGSGVSFLNLAEKFDEIHGIDLHHHSEGVRRSFAESGLTPHLRQGSILQLPYEDDSFDAALAISLHEHLQPDQQEQAFAEVRRVLRRGGCYVIGVPGLNPMMTLAFYLLACPIHKHHLTSERRVLEELDKAFGVEVTRYSPAWWPKSWTTYVRARGWKR